MEWIILFVISWILFFLLIDLKKLKTNIYCGVLAMAMQIFVDHQFIALKLYDTKDRIINVFGSSLFFVCGPIFVMGTLLAQYHPQKRYLRIIHVIVISALFSIQEILILNRNALVYLNWHQIDSVGINVGAMALLSWFSIVVLKKERN